MSRRALAIVMAATFTLGCILYRPWLRAPFDLLDFSEFIPRLASASSPLDGFSRLLEYYLGHGRVNVVPYAAVAAKWWAFGDWTPGWQFVRVLLFTFVAREAYLLYVKLGGTRLGAALGLAVFLVAPSASPGWVRLSVGEPLGVLFVLRSCNLAFDARLGAATRSASLHLAVLTLLLGLTKEMLLVCLVVPVALYLGHVPRSREREVARRFCFLAPMIAAATLVAAIIVWGYLQTDSSAYAAEYGTTHPALWELFPPWIFSFFPYDPFVRDAGLLFTLLTVAYLSVLAVGFRLHILQTRDDSRRAAKTWLVLALLLPALISLEYLPWPVFNPFYYLPALVTLGGMTALAVSGLERAGSLGRWSMVAVLAACFSAGALQAHAASSRSFAGRKVIGASVRYVGSLQEVDTLLVGARIVANQSWQGLPETIRRYGPVVGVSLPPVVGVSCTEGEAAARDQSRRIAFMGFSTACRAPSSAARTLRESYHRFDFASHRLVTDSVRVDVVTLRQVSPER